MNDAVIGRVVFPRAGRDKGRPMVIIARADDEHVLLADGELRKVEKPKKKKLKHIFVSPHMVDGVEEKLKARDGAQNAFLREALKAVNEPCER